MKTVQVIGASVIAMMAGFSGAASADWLAGNPYVGGGGSYSIYDGLDDFASDDDEFTRVRLTKNAFGYMLFGGWSLPSNYAIEVSYTDFGEFEVDETRTLGTDQYRTVYTGNITGKAIGMRYDWPASSDMNLFGRVGVMRWEALWDEDSSLNGNRTGSDESNTNSSDLYLGLGGQYALTRYIYLYAEAQYLDAKFDDNNFTSKQPVYAVFGGINFKFGQISERKNSAHGASKNDGRQRDVTACDPKYKDISGIACE